MRKQLLCVATGIVVMALSAPSADAGGFLKKLFGCKKDACCEPEPVCCCPEPEPEPVCCPEPEPVCCEPAPEPVCCPEPEPVVCCPEPEPEPVMCCPEPEPEPVCCEPAPEPEPECCPEPEAAPCCASHPILEGLPEGSKIVSMRIIPTPSEDQVSQPMIASEIARPVVVLAQLDR